MLIILLAVAVGFYVYKHWPRPAGPAIIGIARVADGDTVEILTSRIRLEGIDAPELDQTCEDSSGRAWPCGRVAARELRRHVGGTELTCEPRSIDQYRRVLAICFLADRSDVNAWMVRQGWALAYGRASPYGAEQAEAKAAKRGVWVGTFVPPWEWRRQHPRSD
jgi:endonuclease YncB( thermonuclease family)